MSILISLYTKEKVNIWNEFNKKSKNGIFLFFREYMEYHSDRFVDNSLLFYDDDKLIALMPANISENKFISHGGLTFGGIISDERMHTNKMLEIFSSLLNYLKINKLSSVVYKSIPHIYSKLPSEEDLYALNYFGAKLIRRDVSSSINLSNVLSFSKGRKWAINRAKKNNILVIRSNDYETFMAIEEHNLMVQHGVKPVHNSSEISLLANKFPNNIKLFGSFMENQMLGGVIIYESDNVAHAQYIASSEKGKEIGAIDIIIEYLLKEYYINKNQKYFDFGISTEKNGAYLNVGLIENKEGFGARAIIYDFYELNL